METQRISEMIEQGISTSFVNVEGDGTHFQAVVVSDQFRGKTMLECHKLVYAALGDAMESEIHAISIKTYTDDQWEKLKK